MLTLIVAITVAGCAALWLTWCLYRTASDLNRLIEQRRFELKRLNEYHRQARREILDLQRKHRKGKSIAPLRSVDVLRKSSGLLSDKERLARMQAADRRFKRKD